MLKYLQYILPHHLLSKITFKLANNNNILLKNLLIRLFIKKNKIDLNIYDRKNINLYKNFNDFFTRKLDLSLRKNLNNLENNVLSPADGIITAIGSIKNNLLYQAKNKYFNLASLLGQDNNLKISLSDIFAHGSYFTIYLSPRDYHRIHMPMSGKLEKMIYIPGRLFAVHKANQNLINNLYSKNERVICIFKTNSGYMAVILVGAMLVGSIVTTWHGVVTAQHCKNKISIWNYSDQNISFNLLDELGYFQMGSTVLVLFSNNIELDESILNCQISYGSNILL